MMNTIPRIEGEIGKSSGAVRLLTVATIEEEKVALSKARLQAILESNFESTAQMHKVYS